jgi:hypothetical protein
LKFLVHSILCASALHIGFHTQLFVETLEDKSYPRLDGVLKATTFCILKGNTHNTTNSHFADAIDFPIFSHRHYLKIAFPLMRARNTSNGAVATPSTPHGHKSLGQSAGQKYISLTYDGLNCGHCGRNLFKTFALSRRRARWRVSPAHSFLSSSHHNLF